MGRHSREDNGDHLLVLAGGRRRIQVARRNLPKVLAPVMPGGGSTLSCVLETATKAGFQNPKVVTRGQFNGAFESVLGVARQGVMCSAVPQYNEGTAKAFQLVLEQADLLTSATAVVIAYATMPLVRAETITQILSAHYCQRDLLTVAVCDLSDDSIKGQIRQQLERRARVVEEEGRVTRVVLPTEQGFAGLQLAVIAPYVVRVGRFRELCATTKVRCGRFMTDLVRDVVGIHGIRVGVFHVSAGELTQFKGDPTKVDLKNGYPKDIFGRCGSTPRLVRNSRTKVCA